MSTLTYRQARWIVLGFGSALIAAVALSAFTRGADPVEVLATVLFLPILVALAFWHARGGVAMAVLVSVGYIVLRVSTLPEGLEATEFIGSMAVRVLLYLGLGLFGGWANQMLQHALHKLELYDDIDDVTGVGNARAFLSIADRETARARRYESLFSIGVLSLDRQLFAGVDDRQISRALRRFAQTVEGSVRTTDLVTRLPFDDREDLAIILPETGPQGAEVFMRNLIDRARTEFSEAGMPAENGLISGRALTIPGSDDEVARYAQSVAAVLTRETVVNDEELD